MKSLDKNYLLFQFKDRIYIKNGTEFQKFFEDIMEKAFSDFQKIRPYGIYGDGGNDGYRKDLGIYYQVYAPNIPKINELTAVKKLQEDFERLKNEWSNISEVKEYNFVFNDKYGGSVQALELAITELKKNNPSIEFYLFLAKNLEDIFFDLEEFDIFNLGFNIDQRQAISNAYLYLENVKKELDRENAGFAHKILINSKDIIFSLNDENLSLEYEILECRCLQKLEKIDETKEKYKKIIIKFPKDIRAFLYLAEIYLNEKNFNENENLLKTAEKIDNKNWLLELEQLVRKDNLGEKINTINIDEQTFHDDPKIKANFYRIYGIFFEKSGDKINADSFIEKAIDLNQDRFSNYIAKLLLIENRLFSSQETSQRLQKAQELINETIKIESIFFEFGDIGARNKAILNVRKLNAYRVLEKIQEVEYVSKETFKLIITCYFDKQIEQIITTILQFIHLPEIELNQMLIYIRNSKLEISDSLLNVLIFQFNIKDSLFTEGKKFFTEINNKKYFKFINNLENQDFNDVLKFLENDINFTLIIISTLKNFPNLRKKLIEKLPDDINIQKEKLLLQIDLDEKKFDEAFKKIKQLDISTLSYFECRQILQTIQINKAWDFEIIILQKLIDKESNNREILNLQLQLFNAHYNLKNYLEVINLGEQLIIKDSTDNFLNSNNKEILRINTFIACLARGKIDNNVYIKAKDILEKYPLEKSSYEFKVGIEAEIYLNNNEKKRAFNSIIEGIKIKKVLSDNEFAALYFLIFIKIGDQIDLKLSTLNEIEENTFVKLRGKDKWYYIGDENELNAVQVNKNNKKYSSFFKKKLEEKIITNNEYSSENIEYSIEIIFSIEKYILWQVVDNFNKLSKDGDIEGVQLIEIPHKEDTIDLKNLLKFLEDLNKKTEPIFEMYCKNNIPLAMLAVSEGCLINAIGRIQSEQKGFINFSTGNIEESKIQNEIARKTITNKTTFFIDGTSALFLSETGLLKKIYKYLPDIKVPQSVINLLADVNEKFNTSTGQVGHIGYAQGKIKFSPIEEEKRKSIKVNFIESIQLLESMPNNISVISNANKMDNFSEQKIPKELSDACILAQKENLPILTEDFLYLHMNELQTMKKVPEYFSSLVLIKVLYEKECVTFEDYLNYFYYLSSYRFRFLTLDSIDIEKAVFGDGKIKTVKPENIRKLNFPLTLSEKYGVSFKIAFTVVEKFLLKVFIEYIDYAATSNLTEKILIEVIESFPTNMDKKNLGQMLLIVCRTAINNKLNFIGHPKIKLINETIDNLLLILDSYQSNSKIWIPKS